MIDPPLSCHSAEERDRTGSSVTHLIRIHKPGRSTDRVQHSLYLCGVHQFHSNLVIFTFILFLYLLNEIVFVQQSRSELSPCSPLYTQSKTLIYAALTCFLPRSQSRRATQRIYCGQTATAALTTSSGGIYSV